MLLALVLKSVELPDNLKFVAMWPCDAEVLTFLRWGTTWASDGTADPIAPIPIGITPRTWKPLGGVLKVAEKRLHS